MNQDDIVIDAFDAKLSSLFAVKNEPLPANEFIAQLLPRLERAYRAQQLRRILFIVALLLLAAFLAPLAVQGTMSAFSLVGRVQQLPGVDTLIMVGMVVVAAGIFLRARRWA